MIGVMPTLEARPNDLREDVGVIVALSFTIALSYIGATPVRQGLDSILIFAGPVDSALSPALASMLSASILPAHPDNDAHNTAPSASGAIINLFTLIHL